jgi:hypothetical protein
VDDPEELRAKAAHYRELAAQITDAQARAGIIELARQYEQQAAEMETGERNAGDDTAG